jgi:ABC-type Mn2+/Zn2+ transport system ATPase subunit
LRLGYVPQRTLIDPIFPLTALEVVRSGGMGPKAKGQGGHLLASASRQAAMTSLEQLGVAHLATRPLRDLSGGQQQRVLIARALVRSPELLILDEPAAGMDLPSEKDLLDFVADLNRTQGTNVVLVVHQISLVAGRATKMALINKDLKLFAVGSAEQMLRSERLSDLYDHRMDVIETHGSVLVRAASSEREAS